MVKDCLKLLNIVKNCFKLLKMIKKFECEELLKIDENSFQM